MILEYEWQIPKWIVDEYLSTTTGILIYPTQQ